MKIVLVGEYSRLHNSLKEALQALGHKVTLISTGDDFKDYHSDIKIATTFSFKPLHFISKVIRKITSLDLEKAYIGWQALYHIKRINKATIYQFINQDPLETYPFLTKKIIHTIKKNNGQIFLLACGDDTIIIDYNLHGKQKYSVLTPYIKNPKLKLQYHFALKYTNTPYKNLYQYLLQNTKAVIASDFDYEIPYRGKPKFKGLIPNPINVDKIVYKELNIKAKVIIFLGINSGNAIRKGVLFFEEAIEIIKEQFGTQVKIIKVKNLPYYEYIQQLDQAHIILDQVYSYDQGYNALEAMAKGKVVFTGAEIDFLKHYNLSEDEVCINALPDVAYLVDKLSWLINNKSQLIEIGKKARLFIEEQHHYEKIGKKYLDLYQQQISFSSFENKNENI